MARAFWLAARTLNDVDAAKRGRLGQRLVRRQVRRRLTGPLADRLWRAILR